MALGLGDQRLTYREVDKQARLVANALIQRGIGRGDRVAIACPNLIEFPVVYFAILKAGRSSFR